VEFLEKKTDNKIILTNEYLEFKSSNPIFFFNYTSQFKINKNLNQSIEFSFTLIELFKVLILLIVFTAFFSQYNFQQYLEVIAIFTVLFISINIWIMKSMTRKLIIQAIEYSVDGGEKDFSKEQEEWILDENKCPACGYEISIYHKICPDCGIKLRNTVPKKPYDSSGDYETFKYHITQSKTKK